MSEPTWWLDEPRCPCCLEGADTIIAVPRETQRDESTLGVRYTLYWKCTSCHAEWKMTSGCKEIAA